MTEQLFSPPTIINLDEIFDCEVIDPNIRVIQKENYWKEFSKTFSIRRIYYPGVGHDHILEDAFEPEQIYYVDNDTKLRYGANLIFAELNLDEPRSEYGGSPFTDGAFDVILIQDIHPNASVVDDFLRVLKPEGILVFSTDDCGIEQASDELRLPELQAHPQLTQVDFPFFADAYTAFIKVENRQQK